MATRPVNNGSETGLRKAFREFLRLESAGGILLVAAAGVAILLANSPLRGLYDTLLHVPVTVAVGKLVLDKPLLLWINDGLMAVFFFLVGLEIKREVLEGELSNRDQIVLPVVAAIGGFVVPAGIYVAFNAGDPVAMSGWAIPAATDIAFALGVLSLLSDRVPLSVKVFVTTLAIIDDLMAILVIAVFYSGDLSLEALGLGAVGVAILVALNRAGVTRTAAYGVVGLAIWVCVLKSGVHATLAGVIIALAIPLRAENADGHSPARHLEHSLHPWVAFGILPVFAFANAGVSFEGMGIDSLLEPIPLGISLGLFVGKQLGVFVLVWLLVVLGLAKRPTGASWGMLYGASILTGIGFTMSLFIGTLAFEHDAGFNFEAAVRLGVLAGSLLSAVVGYVVMWLTCPRNPARA
jgi:NhaA family Na+:H+ antiporter